MECNKQTDKKCKKRNTRVRRMCQFSAKPRLGLRFFLYLFFLFSTLSSFWRYLHKFAPPDGRADESSSPYPIQRQGVQSSRRRHRIFLYACVCAVCSRKKRAGRERSAIQHVLCSAPLGSRPDQIANMSSWLWAQHNHFPMDGFL